MSFGMSTSEKLGWRTFCFWALLWRLMYFVGKQALIHQKSIGARPRDAETNAMVRPSFKFSCYIWKVALFTVYNDKMDR